MIRYCNMAKRTRFLILLFCIVCFSVATPILVAYSEGYRFDFEKFKITKTGGIFVRTFPSADQIIIDSDIFKKPGFLANSIFVQSLLPKNHDILVKKEGYYDYIKILPVLEKEVTKLENITLFRNNISFEKTDFNWPVKNDSISYAEWSGDLRKILIKSKSDYFLFEYLITNSEILSLESLNEAKDVKFDPQNSNQLFYLKNNQLYYYLIPRNIKTVPAQKPDLLIKDILSYNIINNQIIWLGLDGSLNQSDILGKNTEKLTNALFSINKKSFYKIFLNNFGTFILENSSLFILDEETKIFEKFLDNINDLKISPDGKNIFYINNNKIWLNHSNYIYSEKQIENTQKILLNKFYEKISDCFWLNNDYLLFKADNKIKISEIDNRGNINIIDLPITLSDNNPKIYFNQNDKKLHILDNNNLIVSEKLIP